MKKIIALSSLAMATASFAAADAGVTQAKTDVTTWITSNGPELLGIIVAVGVFAIGAKLLRRFLK